jgi:hypothetical protein
MDGCCAHGVAVSLNVLVRAESPAVRAQRVWFAVPGLADLPYFLQEFARLLAAQAVPANVNFYDFLCNRNVVTGLLQDRGIDLGPLMGAVHAQSGADLEVLSCPSLGVGEGKSYSDTISREAQDAQEQSLCAARAPHPRTGSQVLLLLHDRLHSAQAHADCKHLHPDLVLQLQGQPTTRAEHLNRGAQACHLFAIAVIHSVPVCSATAD